MEELDQSIFSLFQIGNSIHNINKKSEKLFGISLVQWCLLKQLVDMPATSAHGLSKATGVHASTMTQTLKRLERKKFVFITEDSQDSRRKLISITREGKEVMDFVSRHMKDWIKEFSEVNVAMKKFSIFLQSRVECL